MIAEIVTVDQYDDGKYDWDEEAIILTPSSVTERTFLENILKRSNTRVSLRIFDEKTHAEWIGSCNKNRAIREAEAAKEEKTEE